MRRVIWTSVLLTSAFVGHATQASTIRLGEEAIARQSIAVIIGQVIRQESYWPGKRITLKGTNPKHKNISVAEKDELRIQGVVRGIVERRL